MDIVLFSTQIFPSTPLLDNYGGLELIVGLLAKYYDEHGHTVHLFGKKGSYVPHNGKLFSVETDKKTCEDAPLIWRSFLEEKDALKTLRDCDILHDHSWGFCPYQLFEEKKGMICHTHHGTIFAYSSSQMKMKANFIAVSYNNAKMQAATNGLEWRAVQNGIDISKYPYQKDKEDYLLWASRIYGPKGLHRFIDICDKMKMKGKFFGAGFHAEKQYVNLIKKKLERSKYVRCIGKFGESISFQKKLEAYQNARAVVLPALENFVMGDKTVTWIEPFGLIVPEANACGTPVVVTPTGGWGETTVHGRSGFFANSDNDFIHAINRLDEIKTEDCRKQAQNFTYQKMGENYLSLYKEIIKGNGW